VCSGWGWQPPTKSHGRALGIPHCQQVTHAHSDAPNTNHTPQHTHTHTHTHRHTHAHIHLRLDTLARTDRPPPPPPHTHTHTHHTHASMLARSHPNASSAHHRYFDSFIPDAMASAAAARANGSRYRYLIQPWVVALYLDCANAGMVSWAGSGFPKEGTPVLHCPNASAADALRDALKSGDVYVASFNVQHLPSGVWALVTSRRHTRMKHGTHVRRHPPRTRFSTRAHTRSHTYFHVHTARNHTHVYAHA
jgi:hypothetical protein